MRSIGHCHVQSLHTLCVLLAGGLLLWLWRGPARAQQFDAAEVTNREYHEFILATGRAAPDHWHGQTFPPGAGEEPVTLVTWYEARDYCAWRGKRLPSQDEWRRACHAPEFPKRGNIWEWTQSEEEGWKVLCGPQGTCDCSHRYRPTWKNAVKGFRCVKDQPMALRFHLRQRRLGAGWWQGIQSQLGVEGLAAPAVLVLRAVIDQQEKTGRWQALHQAVEEGLCLGINPVQVLKDQQQRLHLTLTQQHARERGERALAPLGWVKLPKRAVVREGF